MVSNFRDELLFNDVYFIRSELNPKLSGFEISCLFSEHFFANWKGIDDDFVGWGWVWLNFDSDDIFVV